MLRFIFIAVVLLIGSEAIDHRATKHSGYTSANHVHVFMPHGDVRYNTGETAELFCDYALSSGKDLPVTITWKAGWFPYEYPIFRCKGYTKASEKCTSMEWLDDDYFYRTGLATESPSLIISSLVNTDADNYWCEVAVENPTNPEMEYDKRSVVIYLNDIAYNPFKLLYAVLPHQDVIATAGQDVTLECICSYGGPTNYCGEDVLWFKGPSSDGTFVLIYQRFTQLDDAPQHIIDEAWQDRVSLNGDSLQISNIQVEDSGRYWCDFRVAAYKIGWNPFAMDAKSLTMEVEPMN